MSNERKSTQRVDWIYDENRFSTGALTEPQGTLMDFQSMYAERVSLPNG